MLLDLQQIDHLTTDRATAMLEKLKVQDEMLSHAGPHTVDQLVPNLRELSQVDLADTHFGSETPVYTGIAAFAFFTKGKPVGGFGNSLCHFFIYRDGTGVFWCREWKWSQYSMVPNKTHRGPKIKWRNGIGLNKMLVRHYAFGCPHEYRGATAAEIDAHNARPMFRTDHAYICEKCGHFYVVDSSD